MLDYDLSSLLCARPSIIRRHDSTRIGKPFGETWLGRSSHDDLRGIVPGSAGMDGIPDGGEHLVVNDYARFEVECFHFEHTIFAVRLGIQSPDQPIAIQDRQREVAVDPFGSG